ncbi:MAG TPA: c-type cytochrome [Alphaproteobacteria bacterium]|nr:c-type cytochrome [Alphaproteobacteria bacterium]
MIRVAILGAIALLFACGRAGAAVPGATSADANAQVMLGTNVFTTSCSSSYCHGAGGAGGRGPSLQNRDFPPEYIRDTILNGRPGTPMPSFKGTLQPHEVDALVAFIESLSPDRGRATPFDPSSVHPPAGKQALAGSDLFFDETRAGSCSACHSYGGGGGPIGPDLATIADKTPSRIYQALLHPAAEDPDYPAVTVTLKNGGTYIGIRQSDRRDAIRVYDLSSVPPVLRTWQKTDVAKVEPLAGAQAYKHDLSRFTDQELLALVSFLKSGAASTPVDLKPQDLGPR